MTLNYKTSFSTPFFDIEESIDSNNLNDLSDLKFCKHQQIQIIQVLEEAQILGSGNPPGGRVIRRDSLPVHPGAQDPVHVYMCVYIYI